MSPGTFLPESNLKSTKRGYNLPRNMSLKSCPVGKRTDPEHPSSKGKLKTSLEEKMTIYKNMLGRKVNASACVLCLLLLFLKL